MSAVLSDAMLRAACEKWQKRLRLQDWEIRLQIARQHELGDGTLGDCDAAKFKRQALIRVLHPDDVAGQGFRFDGEAWNWELTLVHELLHLHFHDCFPDGWPARTPTETAAERAIHALSVALVPQEPIG